jgi:hypothetical protein
MTEDAKEKEKEEAQRKAEARFRDEAAVYRRKEEAEARKVKYGCIGCLGLLLLLAVVAFVFS